MTERDGQKIDGTGEAEGWRQKCRHRKGGAEWGMREGGVTEVGVTEVGMTEGAVTKGRVTEEESDIGGETLGG